MFDVSFSELLVIALVALIVIGPERLPKVARTAGQLWGRLQRYVSAVKQDIASDVAVEEVRRIEGTIEQHVAEAERAMQEGGLSLEQHLLQAQHRKPPVGEPETPASSPDNPPK